MFSWNILLPSLRLKSKPRKKPATNIHLLLASFLPGLYYDPEDGGSTSANFYWAASYYFPENNSLCSHHGKKSKSDITAIQSTLLNSHLSTVYPGNNFKPKKHLTENSKLLPPFHIKNPDVTAIFKCVTLRKHPLHSQHYCKSETYASK